MEAPSGVCVCVYFCLCRNVLCIMVTGAYVFIEKSGEEVTKSRREKN